jgi:hypothetical protein
MAPISTTPSAAITVYFMSLHQVKPRPAGSRAASISVSKNAAGTAASAGSLRSARNFVSAACVFAPARR